MTRPGHGDPTDETARLSAAGRIVRHLPHLSSRLATMVVITVALTSSVATTALWSHTGPTHANSTSRTAPSSTPFAAFAPSQTRVVPPVRPAQLAVSTARPGLADWDSRLRLHVSNGSMRSVHVDDGTRLLPGTLAAADAGWVSATTLIPSTTYTVLAVLRQSDGSLVTRHAQLRSTPATHTITVGIFPSNGTPVGIGQPVVASFSGPVTDRAAAQQALLVHTVPPVAGAWRWFSATEAHYRPAGYWPAGTTISVTTALHRVQLAPGVWGVDKAAVTVRIGAAHLSVVDVAGHTMTVYSGGQVVQVFKISAGRDRYPTREGVHIVLSKQPDKLMDSATVGIPRTSADGYYEHVAWDVRISDGGAFVHSAPWSVKDQGVRNVSHGCVNLAPADGEWFFHFSQPGDVVNILHSSTPPLLTDPGTEDWNYTWNQWLQGGAAGA